MDEHIIEVTRGDLDEYRRQWHEGDDAMDVAFAIAACFDDGRLEAKYATEMGIYHLYGASRAALVLGTLIGYGYAARRLVMLMGPVRATMPLIAAGLTLALINLGWILLVSYPARRRRWQKGMRVKGNQLSALFLQPGVREKLNAMTMAAGADSLQARLWTDDASRIDLRE